MCRGYSFAVKEHFLVTGGAGFIGSNLVEQILALGHDVSILDNFSTGYMHNIKEFESNTNFHLYEGDIRNINHCRNACRGVSYVLHQAALGSVPRSIDDPITTNDVNITGTLNMMVAARDQKVKRFVFASSSSVYGDDPSLPKIEDCVGLPLSPYAITKKACELYAYNFFSIYGLPTIGLRYFNVYGKRQDPLSKYSAVIPAFVKALVTSKSPVIHGDGLQSRDFTFIEDVVQANLRACLANDDALGQVFNVAYGGRESLLNVYEELARILGTDIQPTFTVERAGDVKHSNADISKARRLLSYEPQYSLRSGLAKAVDWYTQTLR